MTFEKYSCLKAVNGKLLVESLDQYFIISIHLLYSLRRPEVQVGLRSTSWIHDGGTTRFNPIVDWRENLR